MRNNVKILIFSLLIHPFVSIGQIIQTFNHNVSTGYIGQGMDVEIDGPLIYQYYLDENNKEIRHGKLTYNGSGTEKFYGSVTAKGSRNVVANYSNGVINGAITIKEQYQVIYGGRTYSSNLSFSGNFNNGVPEGEWKFVESGNLNPEFEFRNNFNKDVFGNVYGMNLSSNGVPIEANRSRSVTVRFKKGRITYAFNKRANTIELNVSVDDSIRVYGSEKEKEIIQSILASNGIFDTLDLIDKGYLFRKKYESIIDDSDLRGYINRVDLYDYYYPRNGETFDSWLWRLYENKIISCYLEKIDPVSYEEAIKYVEETNKKIYNYRYDDQLIMLNKEYAISTYEGEKYVNKEVKDSLVSYLTEKIAERERIAEERRKEQERIAEEMRKEQERIAEEKRKEQERIEMAWNTCDSIKNLIKEIRNHCTISKKEYLSYKYGTNPVVALKFQELESGEIVKIMNKDSYPSFLSIEKDYVWWTTRHYSNTYTEGDVSYLKRICDIMKYFKQNIMEETEVKEIKETCNKIKIEAGKNYSDVAKAYNKVFNEYDLTPIFKSLGEYDAYVAKLKAVEIEQESCLQFIALRKEISENKAKIDSHKKECKNIVSVHDEYLKNADVSWSQDSTSIEKVKNIIAIQEKFLQAVTNSNASDFEMAVKKLKDKSLGVVLRVITQ